MIIEDAEVDVSAKSHTQKQRSDLTNAIKVAVFSLLASIFVCLLNFKQCCLARSHSEAGAETNS